MHIELATEERRRHPRRSHDLPETAIVRTRNSIARYPIRDLSVGGVRIVGTPALDVDAIVEVVLECVTGTSIQVMARVARSDSRGVGLCFLHRRAETEDEIQALLLAELERRATGQPS